MQSGQCSISGLVALALNNPLTFSITTYFGCIDSIALANSLHSPERVPGCSPALLPARDKSWQGNPPVRMSTCSTSLKSTFETSLKLGTSQCLARIAEGASSHSQCQTVSALNIFSTAKSSPPYPENRLPIFT